MTKTFEILDRGRTRMRVRIGGEAMNMGQPFRDAFLRIMELRGWTAQQTYDHLMATKWDWPWKVLIRLSNRMFRERVKNDKTLGELWVSRSSSGLLQMSRAPRDAKNVAACILVAPHDWHERYAHIKAGDCHDEAGEYLFTWGDKESYTSYMMGRSGRLAA